ncbi:pectinesterase family protein [Gorillibacterium sp. sgz5001074]|uniref:pectinesterase family protein n=1 Tax=Gorillibacterium sp. sgz5001074 TaxID=3446695 RepID=UPI003F6638C4
MGSRFMKAFKRRLAMALSAALVAASVSMALPAAEVRATEGDSGTTATVTETVYTPKQDTTYTYDFKEFSTYTSTNKITTARSSDGLLKLNGGGTMYYHDTTHGMSVFNGNTIEIPVAGNAIITFLTCKYGATGTISVSGGASGSKVSAPSVTLKGTVDGEAMVLKYAGNPTTLIFTIQNSGESYLHGIKVENTSQPIEISNWAQKSFALQIGGTTLNVTGAAAKTGKSSATISSGSVYYALNTSAMVSLDLAGNSLSPSILTNGSPSIVQSLSVDSATNEIVAAFADQTTEPAEYRIKVQDQKAFVTPSVTDVFNFDLAGNAMPHSIAANTLAVPYTTDNGILTIATGSGSSKPYWHDSSHGVALFNGNYMDVKVAGDALISFEVCVYGAGGTLEASNLAAGGTGTFDSNVMKSATDGALITYTYKGNATTLRFTLTSTGESYLHEITVKNTGTMVGSPVAHVQPSMPVEVDSNDALSVTAEGHRMYVKHTDTAASIGTLTGVGYYLFPSRADAATIEADVTIQSVGTSDKQGVFFGMFDGANPVSKIATLGVRGNKTVRNIYNNDAASAPSAGSTNEMYNVGDVVHLVSQRTAAGWHTETRIGSKNTVIDLVSSKIYLISNTAASVRYGFAFANVDAMITNLVFKDAAGNVLYDQKAAYNPVGTAPAVTSVEAPVLSTDRTAITVSWNGDIPEKDGVYVVEVSTDNGATYKTYADNVAAKTIKVGVQESGIYKFKVYGKCGEQRTSAAESASVYALKPLEAPVVTLESGDGVLTARWNGIATATAYEVYRKSSEEAAYTKLAETADLIYVDRSVVNETPYYYYVKAKSAANSSNPSVAVLSVPSAGHSGAYVYEGEAADIVITKKSYDTVFTDKATLEGTVDRAGTLRLEVNGAEQSRAALEAHGTFQFRAALTEGRNDVNLYFTDEQGKVTRKTFNFVYLTNYQIVVDAAYTGADGAAMPENPAIKMYKSVQAAVNSVPTANTSRVVILVKEGQYVEHLRIASPYISLVGEDRDRVNINFYDRVLSPEGGSTEDRNAVYIKSTATGFTAENLTFENTYRYLGDGTKSNESADALRVDADRSLFVNVKLVGYQDTLYAASNRQYYYKSYILGNVDFIYGGAQALFEDSDIVFRYNAKKNSGYVTAPNTAADKSYGYIFNNSRITAEEGAFGSKYMLARPWGAAGAATFINTYMGGIVNKTVPYADMSGNLWVNARFNEYYTYGGGFAIHSGRPQISKAQAEAMLSVSSLGWNPSQAAADTSLQAYVGDVLTEGPEKFIETEYVNENADPNSTKDRALQKFALEGYAAAQGVTGGGLLLETSQRYYKVATAEQFLQALVAVKESAKASVIELTADIALGSKEIGNAITTYSSVITPHTNQPLTHPTLLQSGVSTLSLSGMSNLTLFSKNGAKLTHTTVKINNSSNIIIRNLAFDEIWEWDEATHGDYDRNDWDYITVEEGSTGVWIDHCTFYKAYDGIVDVKKAGTLLSNVTVSWSKFLPGSEGAFFDVMMDTLEANPGQYPYYQELLTAHGMTKEQLRAYSRAQKKTHLIGASDTEENAANLRLTLANNYYYNSMDRMPRMRKGEAHVYNTIMDASELLALRATIADEYAASKVVSNGAISTQGAKVLVENSSINGISKALLSGNGTSPAGYIGARNTVYILNGVPAELAVTDSVNAGLVMDIDAFKLTLPYRYTLYDPNTLASTVLPYAGAGAVTMSYVQWEKTVYNGLEDPSSPSNEEVTDGPVPGPVVAGPVASTPDSTAAGNGDFSGAVTESVKDGVVTAVIDAAKVRDLLSKINKDQSVLQFVVHASGNVVKAELTPEVLKAVSGKSNAAVLQIVSEAGSYSLPANLIDVQAIAQQWGVAEQDLKIGVTLEKVIGDKMEGVRKAASDKGANVLGEPVEFSVIIEAPNGKKQEWSTFSTYVKRTLHLPKAVNPQSAAGALYNPVTKTLTPVPTVFNGTEATLLRQGNSIYTVIEHAKTYADLSGHWAKADVDMLASKLIVNGVSDTAFAPDQSITRAEFAALLVRALGLNEGKAVGFSDVADDDWFSGAIGAAKQAGLVNGFDDGSFRPNAGITREEMVTMIVRALKFGGQETKGDPSLLDRYADRSSLSSWSKEAAAQALSAGIIRGTSETTFAPQNNATRAEAAAMLKRTLQALKFINE